MHAHQSTCGFMAMPCAEPLRLAGADLGPRWISVCKQCASINVISFSLNCMQILVCAYRSTFGVVEASCEYETAAESRDKVIC